MSHCHDTRENLSRFLDNDLDGAESTEAAAHLDRCFSCRHEYDRLRDMRAALRRMASPDGDGAQSRVFSRLAAKSIRGAQHGAPIGAPRRAWPSFWLRPSYAAGLAAAVTACAAYLAFSPAVTPATATALPGAAEMSQFYALHDAHCVGISYAGPVGHRDLAAEGRATLIASADETVGGSL